MGTPDFSVPVLEGLMENYNVVLVVTQPDKEVGRHKVLTPPPVKKTAIDAGIPVLQPKSIKKEYQDDFNFKVKRLVEGYNRFGYFLDEFGMPTNDGNIVAEASILNLIMLSRDNHIVGDNKENKKKQLKDRYEKIKFVNRKCLKGDFNGRQAEPKNLYEFLNMVKEGIPATSLNNFPVLSDETQRFLHCELHYQPNEHKKHHEDDDEFCL